MRVPLRPAPPLRVPISGAGRRPFRAYRQHDVCGAAALGLPVPPAGSVLAMRWQPAGSHGAGSVRWRPPPQPGPACLHSLAGASVAVAYYCAVTGLGRPQPGQLGLALLASLASLALRCGCCTGSCLSSCHCSIKAAKAAMPKRAKASHNKKQPHAHTPHSERTRA